MKTEKLIIPLGVQQDHQCWEIARENNAQIRNWRGPAAALSGKTGSVTTHNCGRYRGRSASRFTKYEYTPTMRSWGVIQENGSVLVGLIGRQKFKLKLPKAFTFMPDGAKVKVARRSDSRIDYHFNSGDVLRDNAVRNLLHALRHNHGVRLQQNRATRAAKQYERIFQREVVSTRVTLEDSRRAGNCVEGSLDYAEKKLGIQRQEILNTGYLFSVPATLLMRNGEPLPMRAVRVAFMRETTVSI